MLAALVLLAAQQWNAPEARALVDRAIMRRDQGATGLTGYSASARGVVLFQIEVGDPSAPPRLVKADELRVNLFYRSPGRTRQTIAAWRERRFLPTDIRYHRDHLAVVTDDFGDRIRLGDGDEVRDVPHPLSGPGRDLYEVALGNRVMLRGATGDLVVQEVLVRPRDPAEPRVAGTMYLDTATADLVRFRFGFTAAAYLQPDLEDITLVLERALFARRWWLPWRQELEIRRRTAWLEFPFRTVIRTKWEIDDYDVAAGDEAPPPPVRGVALLAPAPDTGWGEPLETAVAWAGGSARRADLGEIRREVGRLVGRRAAIATPPARLAFGALSDIARFNRVQGLALGAGATLALSGARLALSPAAQYGFASRRLTGGASLSWRPGAAELALTARREVRDMGDWPAASGLLNSVLAQEGGQDFADWLELDMVGARLRWRGERVGVTAEAGVETSRSLPAIATPASGTFPANPALGAGTVWTGRLGFDWTLGRGDGVGGVARSTTELGAWDRGYVRQSLEASVRVPTGATRVEASVRGGVTGGTAPAWRSFVLGGRGTLVGERFRGFAGRQAVLGRVEWRIPVRLPAIRLGDYLDLGSGAAVAPFAAIGWTSEPPGGTGWVASNGVRPVFGLASELLFNGLRIEVGWATRSRRVGLTVDAAPAWWPVL